MSIFKLYHEGDEGYLINQPADFLYLLTGICRFTQSYNSIYDEKIKTKEQIKKLQDLEEKLNKKTKGICWFIEKNLKINKSLKVLRLKDKIEDKIKNKKLQVENYDKEREIIKEKIKRLDFWLANAPPYPNMFT